MAPRKRKSPDRRKVAKQPGLASRAFLAAGGSVGGTLVRHPKPVLGGAAFIVMFSFVAANALWYQPGEHPSPFLATRDPNNPDAIAGYRPFHHTTPDDVTTFRIQRAPVGAPAGAPANTPAVASQPSPSAQNRAAQPVPGQGNAVAAQPQQQTVESLIQNQGQSPQQIPAQGGPQANIAQSTAPTAGPGGRDLITQVQHELARRGLYDGAEDGLSGTKTEAAILFFQESRGLPQTGTASPQVLAALKAEPQASNAAGQQGANGQGAAGAANAQQLANARPLMPPVPAPSQRPTSAQRLTGAQNVSPLAVQPSRSPARSAASAASGSLDPVAAAIHASEGHGLTTGSTMIPPADIPGRPGRALAQPPFRATVQPASVSTAAMGMGGNDLVVQIQRGLSNIAYTDVRTDGVADAQTKEAIRRFQHHYRLPETGEPSEMVLRKLKAIGAL